MTDLPVPPRDGVDALCWPPVAEVSLARREDGLWLVAHPARPGEYSVHRRLGRDEARALRDALDTWIDAEVREARAQLGAEALEQVRREEGRRGALMLWRAWRG